MELRTLRYFLAVAETLHFGRAAERLHMSQPPLSRAIKQLEAELGATLFERTATGTALTPAGVVLLDEARALLDQAERTRRRVASVAGNATLTIGILGDSNDSQLSELANVYRRRHPDVEVQIRETDLTDPTCGLRKRAVDIALTRAPFDETGLTIHGLRADAVGVLLRADDPLAHRESLELADLADRRWFRFPDGTDASWQSYWHGGKRREGPIVRAIQECQQAVLWNGTIGMTVLDHRPPSGLTIVPVLDMAPSRVVLAWNENDRNRTVRSFVELATSLQSS